MPSPIEGYSPVQLKKKCNTLSALEDPTTQKQKNRRMEEYCGSVSRAFVFLADLSFNSQNLIFQKKKKVK